MLSLLQFCVLFLPHVTHSETIFEDFESGTFTNWQVSGNAFGKVPAHGDVGRQRGVKGYAGKGTANSFHADDRGQGKMISRSFKITTKYIAFLIGGGNHEGKTCLVLVIGGKSVRTAVGRKSNTFYQQVWDVAEFKNKKAHLEIIDSFSGGWGFIMVDHIVFSDEAKITVPKAQPPKGKKKQFVAGIQVPEGFKIDLYADETQVTNPTAICFDEQGRLFAAETHRFRIQGGADNRENVFWLMDDLAAQTTADRLAFYKKWEHKKGKDFFTKHSERIRLIEDTDGDGKADRSRVFAESFNHPLDGTAGGVIAREGKIYFSCIPHVWMLEDKDGDGLSDERKSLQEGFGVRVSISGHDMNGFAWGPDGKLYWSVGDRGFNIRTKEGRHYKNPDRGGILRCDPDGSNIEVVFTGLRNPKEVAFDHFGNLFTVDNNANIGDRSRVHYIVEGGDAGWHTGHQVLTTFGRNIGIKNDTFTPWTTEGIWKTKFEGQPADVIPPVAYLTSGPVGLTFYPGLGLPERYNNHFFVCDYKASAPQSGVHAFEFERDGAGYKMVDAHQFIWGINNTDVEFGYDGRIYVSDYIGGWSIPNKGKIHVAYHPESRKDKRLTEVKEIFAKGFERPAEELFGMLGHPDMRVRLRAQFALAKAGGTEFFIAAASSGEHLLKRLHGVWGLGQSLRFSNSTEAEAGKQNQEKAFQILIELLKDSKFEIRRHSARVLGNTVDKDLAAHLIPLLKDGDPSVRVEAGLALGKLKHSSAVAPLVALIAGNANKDVYVRHAGVMGMVGCMAPEELTSLAGHADKSVRLAGVLALRRLSHAGVAQFLKDKDAGVLSETIRAINDENIKEAVPALAAILERRSDDLNLTEINWHRVINANFRLGTRDALLRLFGAVTKLKQERLQLIALERISQWCEPHPVDRSVGRYRPVPKRELEPILESIHAGIGVLIETTSGKVLARSIALSDQYKLKLDTVHPLKLASSKDLAVSVRLRALDSAVLAGSETVWKVCLKLTDDPLELLAGSALKHLAARQPELAISKTKEFLNAKSIHRQRSAYEALGIISHPEAPGLLIGKLESIHDDAELANTIPPSPSVLLELIEACEKRKETEVAKALKAHRAEEANLISAFPVSLAGGDRKAGEIVFQKHGAAQCLRCHKVRGNGGDAGPELSGIGHKGREYLLRSLVEPAADITPGFSTINLLLKDESVQTGLFLGEDDTHVFMRIGKKKEQVSKDNIEERSTPTSAMPSMADILSKREMRDLIEFLSSLKARKK